MSACVRVFDKQMMQVCIDVMPACPLLLLSKSDVEKKSVLGIAYVPKVSPYFPFSVFHFALVTFTTL